MRSAPSPVAFAVTVALAALCLSACDGGYEPFGDGAGQVVIEEQPEPEPEYVDLFDCGIPLTCDGMYTHRGGYLSDNGTACAGPLVASGEPGYVIHGSKPGPQADVFETAYYLLGDGTAVSQARERRCAYGEECPEWTWSVPMRCVNTLPDATIQSECSDVGCLWLAVTEFDCTPAPELTCADIQLGSDV